MAEKLKQRGATRRSEDRAITGLDTSAFIKYVLGQSGHVRSGEPLHNRRQREARNVGSPDVDPPLNDESIDEAISRLDGLLQETVAFDDHIPRLEAAAFAGRQLVNATQAEGA